VPKAFRWRSKTKMSQIKAKPTWHHFWGENQFVRTPKKGKKKELKGREFMIWRTKMQATHLGCFFSFWGQKLEVNLKWAKGVTLWQRTKKDCHLSTISTSSGPIQGFHNCVAFQIAFYKLRHKHVTWHGTNMHIWLCHVMRIFMHAYALHLWHDYISCIHVICVMLLTSICYHFAIWKKSPATYNTQYLITIESKLCNKFLLEVANTKWDLENK
jgi:hypothetical protein